MRRILLEHSWIPRAFFLTIPILNFLFFIIRVILAALVFYTIFIFIQLFFHLAFASRKIILVLVALFDLFLKLILWILFALPSFASSSFFTSQCNSGKRLFSILWMVSSSPSFLYFSSIACFVGLRAVLIWSFLIFKFIILRYHCLLICLCLLMGTILCFKWEFLNAIGWAFLYIVGILNRRSLLWLIFGGAPSRLKTWSSSLSFHLNFKVLLVRALPLRSTNISFFKRFVIFISIFGKMLFLNILILNLFLIPCERRSTFSFLNHLNTFDIACLISVLIRPLPWLTSRSFSLFSFAILEVDFCGVASEGTFRSNAWIDSLLYHLSSAFHLSLGFSLSSLSRHTVLFFLH